MIYNLAYTYKFQLKTTMIYFSAVFSIWKGIDFLFSLKAVISTNESTELITGHVIYNPAYTYKFQLKTTLYLLGLVHCYRVQMQAF